jgi:ammonium transporter Rh
MIGTLFLWLYWPSFNGALAEGNAQHRVVINTVLALTGSCLGAFLTSYLVHGKFSMTDVQNATLAGGVAVGTTADLAIGPHGAIIIGFVAGTVCTLGFRYLTPVLNVGDTCGVHNLHGISGVIGGITGVIVTAIADESDYGDDLYTLFPARANGTDDRSAGSQASYQLAALATTLGIAIGGGMITGLIMSFLPHSTSHHDDSNEWVFLEKAVDEMETPTGAEYDNPPPRRSSSKVYPTGAEYDNPPPRRSSSKL